MLVLPMALGLGLAGCPDNKATLEESIRSALTSQMTVTEVNMTVDSSCHYAGFARGVTVNGFSARRNCTAAPLAEGRLNWNCVPGIDEESTKVIEFSIKVVLSEKGTVQWVRMARGADEDHMVGSARMLVNGRTVTKKCTAKRQPPKIGTDFVWDCR